MNHVVIVGAGISGLATAHWVARESAQRGLAIRTTVLESSDRPGGRVWTERTQGFQVELGATSFLDSKRSTLDLCGDMKLDGALIAARPEAKDRYIFWRDQLHKLPAGLGGLLTSGLLSSRGKLRLLGEAFVRARQNSGDESVHESACRRVGREAAEVLVDAMVAGIHAGDPTQLSVAAAFPRMNQLEREHGSLIRAMARLRRKPLPDSKTAPDSTTVPHATTPRTPGGTVWSFRAGMRQLVDGLTDSGTSELLRGVRVRRIARDATGQWTVYGEGTDQWQANSLVLACPSFVQAELLEPLDSEFARLVGGIRYNSIAVVALGFRKADLPRPLDGFGYLSPQRMRRDVLGVLWNSSIFENRAPPGMILLQAMCGGWNRPDIVGWDDDRLVRAVLDELRHTMDIAASPTFMHITRWPQAIPQYQMGHLDRVQAIEARRRHWPGLYLTGNSFRGIAVNDCTEEAIRCANEIVQDLCIPATSASSATLRDNTGN